MYEIIVPIIKEISVITNAPYFDDSYDPTSPKNDIKKSNILISNLIHPKNVIQSFNDQHLVVSTKKFCIKKNEIKYHNFENSHQTSNQRSNLVCTFSLIEKQTNINNIKFNNTKINNIKSSTNHIRFSPQEDEMLKQIVNKVGAKNWRQIAILMPGRNSRQCRDRYTNYLKPEISKLEWDEEEDLILVQKYLTYGPKWSTINLFLPHRTANSIKNRYNYTLCMKINKYKAFLRSFSKVNE